MKYKKLILKPIYNYIPQNKEQNTNLFHKNNTTKPLVSNNVSFKQKEQLQSQARTNTQPKKNIKNANKIFNKTSFNKTFKNLNKSFSVSESKVISNKKSYQIKNSNLEDVLLNNTNYTQILKQTDELIKKLKNISKLEKEKTQGFLISPTTIKRVLNNSTSSINKSIKFPLKGNLNFQNKTRLGENITQTLFKLVNNQSNISTLKFFIKNNKGLLILDLFLIFVFIFIILKLLKFIFKKQTIPEELLYITIRDPFEEAVGKTKNIPKIGTIIVKNEEDIPSSACILGDLIIIGKVKLPEYVYVKGIVKCENFVEIDTLVCENNIFILKGGYLKTLLASKKIIQLSKNFESKGIILGEQIRTYNYKDYDFTLPISSSKRKVLEYKGNFKIPEEVTLAQDLVIHGDLEILPFAKILGNIRVYGNIKLWNNVKVSGGVFSSGKIKIMENCIIGKSIIAGGRVEISPGCRLNIFSGRIASYKDIILHEDICTFGSIMSPLKVK